MAPPPSSITSQRTVVSTALNTDALNCKVRPRASGAAAGATATPIAGTSTCSEPDLLVSAVLVATTCQVPVLTAVKTPDRPMLPASFSTDQVTPCSDTPTTAALNCRGSLRR